MNQPNPNEDTPARVVLVTAPNRETAKRLATSALSRRLVACANIIPQVESHYWWNEQLESSTELLILFKTTAASLEPLKELILRIHPYEVPEFIALNISTGSQPYLDWIRSECRSTDNVTHTDDD